MSEADERGFVVIDKRGREAEEPAAETPPASEASEASEAPEAGTRSLPRVDFASFAMSVATSALYHLGLVEDPQTGKPAEPDLELARHSIDTLSMLQEKTRGNLQSDEERLLQSLLTDLRMRFVDASK